MTLGDLPAAMAGQLAEATALTLFVSTVSFASGLPLAMALLAARSSGFRSARWLVGGYVSVIRGTPALLQIFVAYYVIPAVTDINLSPLEAGIFALTLNTAAFTSEALRGALISIPAGQRAAALALGMDSWTLWRHILLPQILHRSLPQLTNELGTLLKATSLLSIISVTEIAAISRAATLETQQPLPIFTATAILYFTILFLVSAVSRRIEAKAARYLPHGA